MKIGVLSYPLKETRYLIFILELNGARITSINRREEINLSVEYSKSLSKFGVWALHWPRFYDQSSYYSANIQPANIPYLQESKYAFFCSLFLITKVNLYFFRCLNML